MVQREAACHCTSQYPILCCKLHKIQVTTHNAPSAPHTWGTGIYTGPPACSMARARARGTRVHWNSEQSFGAVQTCKVFLPGFSDWKWHTLIMRCHFPLASPTTTPDVPPDLLSSGGQFCEHALHMRVMRRTTCGRRTTLECGLSLKQCRRWRNWKLQ